MDLTQSKLTRAEWDSIEIPVSDSERKILNLIMTGYNNVNVRENENLSMLQILRIAPSPDMHSYFYREYFDKEISGIFQTQNTGKKTKTTTTTTDNGTSAAIATEIENALAQWRRQEETLLTPAKQMKKADAIRVQNMASSVQTHKNNIYEYILLDLCKNVIISLASQGNRTCDNCGFDLYTLIHIRKNSIPNVNTHVAHFVEWTICMGTQHTNIAAIFGQAHHFIEKNKYILKYQDNTLYSHQKQLFSVFKNGGDTAFHHTIPKLVLYSAPTGTGKTMSPLGLASEYKIIFVCVARHVGLALAKSAISLGRKVAFAFGCETASDIRLHYFSAADYTVNKRSGGIGKVDNSNGIHVEIMICDVKSYITAMHYMLAFNTESQIITYWDEPTITLDYPDHPLHETIQQNWSMNRISKMVLSCATLPKESEIEDVIIDFRMKFENAEIHNITSFDCKKTISLLNKDGYCALPHLLFREHSEVLRCVSHIYENKNLMRYLDLEEIVKFLQYVNANAYIQTPYTIDTYFESIEAITMDSIKNLYLETLKRISSEAWPIIYVHSVSHSVEKFRDLSSASYALRKIKSASGSSATASASAASVQAHTPISRLNSDQTSSLPKQPSNPAKGILITTSDAHTLTDGPTIFLAEDVEKIGKFCVQQSKIPDSVFSSIMQKIEENEVIQKKIERGEQELEDIMASKGIDETKDKKMERTAAQDPRVKQMNIALDNLRESIRVVRLDAKYVPNTKPHQNVWISEIVENAFVSEIDDITVKRIMSLNVDNGIKLLLLLGIGTFTNEPNPQYMEIMKDLATQQKLYVVIAQSDYIYGTNYQFCHGFISKDLANMTQQKTIQAMGRIGRNNIQQTYTIRFRDDALLTRLFMPMEENMEAINMCRLFTTLDV